MGSENLHWFKKKGKLQREIKLIKEYADSLLIVCEGKKTEPNYFEGFQTFRSVGKEGNDYIAYILVIGQSDVLLGWKRRCRRMAVIYRRKFEPIFLLD